MAEKTQKKGFFNHWIVRNLLICIVLVVVIVTFQFVLRAANKQKDAILAGENV